MKNNKVKKIITIGVILLFTAISFQSVSAIEKEDNKFELNFCRVDSENSIITEKLTLSEQEITELQVELVKIMDKLQTVSSEDELNEITESFAQGKRYQPILSMILDVLEQIRMFKNRVFVISQGWSYNLNSNKEQKTSIYKLINMWNYLPHSTLNVTSRTLIFKHSRLSYEGNYLKGTQIGMMSRFRGIHISIPRTLPEKSYTFFIGTAKHVTGFDFPMINSML